MPRARALCYLLITCLFVAVGCAPAPTEDNTAHASEEPAAQEAEEKAAGTCEGAGPQSPRDIEQLTGINPVTFDLADRSGMRLCDIHFHKFAEHKASAYSTLTGEGDHTGYACSPPPGGEATGEATVAGCDGISVGDTVEVHWVFTTCDVEPGPGLGSCFNPVCNNPQLRVEAQVFYLTGPGADGSHDFAKFANTDSIEIPPGDNAVMYHGSTTGPSFSDEVCSPFQVAWNVRPECAALDIDSLNGWCSDNVFGENHAHGVRKLVQKPELLSPIGN